MKKIFFLVFFLGLFLPLTSHAFNANKCWAEQKCIEYRQNFFKLNPSEAREGFITSTESMRDCGTDASAYNEILDGKYGFCLPTNVATTKIGIGGQNTFTDIGDFISYVYKYAFMISGVLAVIMIIIAGVQWIISAGNTSIIEQSRKRILGAVVGLILLASAYTILNTINPYLVNFKTLNTFMINEKPLVTYCDQISDPNKKLLDNPKSTVTVTSSGAICGKTYYIDGATDYTCMGNSCPEANTMCAKASLNATSSTCIDANITGIILNNSIDYIITALTSPVNFSEGWNWKWANEPEIYYVCKDGKYETIETNSNDPKVDYNDSTMTQYYRVALKSDKLNSKNFCNGNLKGFLLSLDFQENVDMTDERHLIGVNNCVGHVCYGVDLGDKQRDILKKASEKYFITEEELLKGLVININAASFRDIDEDSERSFYEFLYN